MDVIDMPDLRRNLRDHERRTRPPLLTRVLDGDCCVSTRSQCVLFTRYFWLHLAGTTTVTRRCFLAISCPALLSEKAARSQS